MRSLQVYKPYSNDFTYQAQDLVPTINFGGSIQEINFPESNWMWGARMSPVTFNIVDMLGHGFCIGPKDGRMVRDTVERAMSSGNKVIVSFDGVVNLSPAFLHSSLGQLHIRHSEADLQDNFAIRDVPEGKERVVDRVILQTNEHSVRSTK
jgi:hypothetical protein